MNEMASLLELALDGTIKNFESAPFQADSCLTIDLASKLIDALPMGMDVTISAKFVENDEYWMRACKAFTRLKGRNSEEHGMSYKRMFFELMVGDILKAAVDDEAYTRERIVEKVQPFADYIHALRIRDICHGFPIHEVCQNLPNLSKIDVKYGSACQIGSARFAGIPEAIACSTSLATLVLKESQITDADLNFLFSDNLDSTLLHLDLSHNKITSSGVKLITEKFIHPSSAIICAIDLSGNKICNIGAVELGIGLASNDSLLSLNLRLNTIGDEGGKGLVSGLTENTTLRQLNLSANKLGSSSALAFAQSLESKESNLESLILTSNDFTEEDITKFHKIVDLR